MNVDSIHSCHWDALSNLALPTVKRLREKWVEANRLAPSSSPRSLGVHVLRPRLEVLKRQVSDHFYSELYEKVTAGLGYELNLPGEPDAAWEKLVAAWQVMAKKLTSQEVVAEPASHARWVPDQERGQCRQCRKDFGLGILTRRHHCRSCGEIFCDNCSKKRMDVENSWNDNGQRVRGRQTNQRVCDGCYESWDALKKNLTKNAPPSLQGDGYAFGIQKDKAGDNDNATTGARLWEYYTKGNVVSRFQFVVREGGGIVLLSRLDRAFKLYFRDNVGAKRAFQGWKIFGEVAGQGRSDSCVIYLLRPFEHPCVQGFWHHVCSHRELRTLRDSIHTSFTAPGLFDMGNGAWGIDLPDPSNEQAVLNEVSGGSAGGFISNVLAAGYAHAAARLHDQPDIALGRGVLSTTARYEVRLLVKRLYPGRMIPLPELDGGLSTRIARSNAPEVRGQAWHNRMGGRF